MDIIEEFKKYLISRSSSESTIAGYVADIGHFSRWINKPLVDVTTSDLEKYQGALLLEIKRNSAHRKMAAIRSLYRWLYRRDIIPANPANKLDGIKTVRKLPPMVDYDETIGRMFAKTIEMEDGWEKAITCAIVACLSAGLRRKEILGLKMSDVDMDNKGFRVILKGDDEHVYQMSPDQAEFVEYYLSKRKAIKGVDAFLVHHHGYWQPLGKNVYYGIYNTLKLNACPVHLNTEKLPKSVKAKLASLHKVRFENISLLLTIVKTIVGDADNEVIRAAIETTIKLTPHKSRHAIATGMVKNGASPFHVKDYFGWRTTETALRYAASVSREAAAFHPGHKQTA